MTHVCMASEAGPSAQSLSDFSLHARPVGRALLGRKRGRVVWNPSAKALLDAGCTICLEAFRLVKQLGAACVHASIPINGPNLSAPEATPTSLLQWYKVAGARAPATPPMLWMRKLMLSRHRSVGGVNCPPDAAHDLHRAHTVDELEVQGITPAKNCRAHTRRASSGIGLHAYPLSSLPPSCGWRHRAQVEP